MQEECSMSKKILTDLEYIIHNDEFLQEFTIVPTADNEKNKSPVLHERHNLGLEMWCVKYVYSYAHTYLLRVKPLLRKNQWSSFHKEELKRVLLGALLLKPEVTTFWNMRRELVEKDIIDINKELMITKLILSFRSKSNETFAYRKWIIKKLLKLDASVHFRRMLLHDEFVVMELAAARASNNYHAWSHQIWCLQTLALKFSSSILLTHLDVSSSWIFGHVSEHAGFHYRQHLLKCIKGLHLDQNSWEAYYKYVWKYLKIDPKISRLSVVLLSDSCSDFVPTVNVDVQSLENYLCILLFELLSTLRRLNESFPDHEAVWYHRRFVLHSFIETACECLKMPWEHKTTVADCVGANENITSVSLDSSLSEHKFQDNGELFPKLFKCENKLETYYFYKLIVQVESDFVAENSASKRGPVQNFLAKRHQKWLKFVLGINGV